MCNIDPNEANVLQEISFDTVNTAKYDANSTYTTVNYLMKTIHKSSKIGLLF